jgi:hypothetical protein
MPRYDLHTRENTILAPHTPLIIGHEGHVDCGHWFQIRPQSCMQPFWERVGIEKTIKAFGIWHGHRHPRSGINIGEYTGFSPTISS